jgi:hypothetical protein
LEQLVFPAGFLGISEGARRQAEHFLDGRLLLGGAGRDGRQAVGPEPQDLVAQVQILGTGRPRRQGRAGSVSDWSF